MTNACLRQVSDWVFPTRQRIDRQVNQLADLGLLEFNRSRPDERLELDPAATPENVPLGFVSGRGWVASTVVRDNPHRQLKLVQ